MSSVLTFPGPASPPASPPDRVELTLHPVADRPGIFDAVDDTGRTVVRSRQPLYDGARTLLAAVTVPDTILQTRHQGSPHIAMRGVLAELAKWTVTEGDRGLQRRPWQPFSGIGADSPAVPAHKPQDGRQAIVCLSVAREARRAPGAPRKGVAAPSRRIAA